MVGCVVLVAIYWQNNERGLGGSGEDVMCVSSFVMMMMGCVAAGRSAASQKKHAPKILFQNVPQIIIVEMCTSFIIKIYKDKFIL